MSADDASFESAMNGLGLLSATFHGNHIFGPGGEGLPGGCGY